MANNPTKFPKIIYSLWMQGRKNAPKLVQLHFDRWERLNPDYQLIVLDEETSKPYLKDFPIDTTKLTVQTFSDILRIRLLAQMGGIWTDASIYPITPLREWLDARMAQETFFAFSALDEYHIPVPSWFIAARVNCPMIQKWDDQVTRYWFMERTPIHSESPDGKPRAAFYLPVDIDVEMGLKDMRPTPRYPYFWVMHLFSYLLRADADFATSWAKIDKDTIVTSADLHGLQLLFQKHYKTKIGQWCCKHGFIKAKKKARARYYINTTPLQKLDWRKEYPIDLFERLANKTPR